MKNDKNVMASVFFLCNKSIVLGYIIHRGAYASFDRARGAVYFVYFSELIFCKKYYCFLINCIPQQGVQLS